MSANVERMSRVDTAWLRMDTEANLMMIVGIWLIEPQLSLADLRERVETALLQYGRFRQKVVEDTLGAQWVDDDHFDIAAHVVPEKLELAPRPVAAGRAQELRRRPHHAAAEPEPPAVAVPPVRGLRDGAHRARRAHPPLHRRRHRADLGDAVDHRRRQVAAARKQREAEDGGRARLDRRLPAQARGRPRGQGDRRLRRGAGQGRRDDGRPGRAAGRQHGDGAHRRAGRVATSPRWR